MAAEMSRNTFAAIARLRSPVMRQAAATCEIRAWYRLWETGKGAPTALSATPVLLCWGMSQPLLPLTRAQGQDLCLVFKGALEGPGQRQRVEAGMGSAGQDN